MAKLGSASPGGQDVKCDSQGGFSLCWGSEGIPFPTPNSRGDPSSSLTGATDFRIIFSLDAMGSSGPLPITIARLIIPATPSTKGAEGAASLTQNA